MSGTRTPGPPTQPPFGVLARGTVLIDPRAAVAKLRDHLLAEPVYYVLEIVRVAVAGGATAIHLENDTDDLVLTFDGDPVAPADLACLLDHLFSAADRRLRLLAIAVNTALGLRPHFVDLYTTRHDGPAETLARVRWRPLDLDRLGDGDPFVPPVPERVPRPAGFPERGMRVHVRERFGPAVLREWLAPAPAETALLVRHAVALPVALLRGGAALAVAPAPRALASVPLDGDAALRGTLALVPPGDACDTIEFCEHGVLLAAHAFPEAQPRPGVAYPLWMRVECDALPTNAARSQVTLDGAFGAAVERARRAALPALVAGALAALAAADTPEGADAVRQGLAALLACAPAPPWTARARAPDLVPDDPLAPLLDAPLVPLAAGTHASPRALATRGPLAPLHVFRGKSVVSTDLAPWMPDVVWLRPGDAALAALLAPLEPLHDARPAIEQARQARARYARFLAHPPRAPRTAVPDDRAALCAAFRRGDVEGEVTLLRPDAPPSLAVTAFLQHRPLGTLDLGAAPLPLAIAVGAPDLRARPAFDGPELDDALQRALVTAADALLDALAASFTSSPPPDGVTLTRDALAALTPAERAAVVRGALRLAFRWRDGAPPDVARAVRARHAPLLALPAWPTTTPGAWLSTEGVAAASARPPRAVLAVPPGTLGERRDGRPVLAVTAPDREVLAPFLPADVAWVDYAPWLPPRRADDLTALLPAAEATPFADVTFALDAEGARAALAPTDGDARLVLAHAGRVLASRPHRAALGPVVVVLEDDALVPAPGNNGALAGSLSPAGRALLAHAEHDLAAALAGALGGDRDAVHAVRGYGWYARRRPPAAVARFLLAAVVALRRVRPSTPVGRRGELTAGDLRARLESVPLVEVCEDAAFPTLRSVRELAARRVDGALPYLTAVPEDVDFEDFRPVLADAPALARAVAEAVEARLEDARDQLPARRDAHARRLARAALQRRPAATLALDLDAPTYTASIAGVGEVVAALASPEGALAGVQVLLDGRVAVERARSPYPLVARAALADPEGHLAPGLDALTPAGQSALDALLDRVAPGVVAALVKRARAGEDAGDAGRALVVAWVLRQADARALDDEQRRLLARAPLWASPQGPRVAALDCLTRSGARKVMYTTGAFAPWLAPPSDTGKRDVPVVQVPPGHDGGQWARCLSALAGVPPSDATAALGRVQRERRMRARDAGLVALPGDAPAPALAGRIEQLRPQLGVGELRLVPHHAGAGLDLSLFAEGALRRTLSLPSPAALAAALESPRVDPEAIDALTPAAAARLRDDLVDAAHALLDRALREDAPRPPWATPALRWHALTAEGPSAARQRAPLFEDTTRRPMSLDDLDAQAVLHGAVAYSTAPWPEPAAPAQPGRRVVLLAPDEVAHLASQRAAVDYTGALLDEQRARAFERLAPAASIVATGPLPDGATRRPLTPARHRYEGEVVLLPRGPCEVTVQWYHRRRRLGASVAPAAWPSVVALEAPDLAPDPPHLAPVHDAAHARHVDDAVALVDAALAEHLRAPDDALCAVALDAPGSPGNASAGPRALGTLWLPAATDVGRTLAVTTSAEGRVVWRAPRVTPTGERAVAVPLGGVAWLREEGATADEARDALVERLVAWGHAKLLDEATRLAATSAAREAALAHLALAALDGLLNTLATRAWSRATCLPGSVTSFWELRNLAEARVPLRVVGPDDPLARLETGVVPRATGAWFEVLRQRVRLRAEPTAALPTATPATTASAPPAPPGAPTLSAELVATLGRLGVGADVLPEVAVDDARARAPATYRAGRVTLHAGHPAVAALLAGDRPRALRVLALAVLGEVNRALREVGDADEERALAALLDELGR